MQNAHVCRKGMQDAVIVPVRKVQDRRVEGVVDAPLGKHLQASQDFFITENTHAECLLGLSLAACNAHWGCLAQ